MAINGLLIGALLFLAAGAIALPVGLQQRRRSCRFDHWQATGATITELRQIAPGGNCTPLYRYTFDGRDYAGSSTIAVRHRHFRQGGRVTVLVDPANPHHSEMLLPLRIGPWQLTANRLIDHALLSMAICALLVGGLLLLAVLAE